jgi:hypothetical protein
MKESSRVGYRQPPKQHQFQPGQSGNPSGRPKGARSFLSDLRDELAEVVPVAEGDGTVEVTKQRAIVRALVRKAVAGDARAIATIVGSCARAFEEDSDQQAEALEDGAILQVIGPKRGKRKSQPQRDE